MCQRGTRCAANLSAASPMVDQSNDGLQCTKKVIAGCNASQSQTSDTIGRRLSICITRQSIIGITAYLLFQTLQDSGLNGTVSSKHDQQLLR